MKTNKMPEAEILQLRRANLKKDMIANASCYHRHISAEKWQEMDINCLVAWTDPNERIDFINEFERIKVAEREYEKSRETSAEDLIDRGYLPKDYRKVMGNG